MLGIAVLRPSRYRLELECSESNCTMRYHEAIHVPPEVDIDKLREAEERGLSVLGQAECATHREERLVECSLETYGPREMLSGATILLVILDSAIARMTLGELLMRSAIGTEYLLGIMDAVKAGGEGERDAEG